MQLAGEGRTVDWLVKMRRLPAERMLDRLIDRDLLVADDIDRIGNVLTGFYRRCPAIALDRDKYVGRMEKALETDRQALTATPYDFSDRYIPVLQALRRFIVNHRKMLERRVAEERIVEGHGDLRPEHICLEPLPVIFDCLVFDYHLRLIDPVDELAFLAMGCARLGVDWVEAPLFQSYTACTGDAPPPPLIAFFKCYRASLWARLACLRMVKGEDDDTWHRRAEEYLRLAVQYSDEMT
jgi:aminoglycoside phosphotransferase family enzyme